ncbi:carbamoyl-phosphate synthase large subunit [Dehalogenimonas etheniformans]|uniref:Carbamoyl phosphate synthase large chain n=1 Tax=Dehalogenimonas etheniformans TaxID=1536648 RepID=A0A2P5P860_9CHLR|nr:carbamoyl-phosphate synthase large subunit [Dehalogenimonas etheniformans]PPD58493.1 carbamoyl-phosphate synthase large subunit [Dehalogenimonas etheniformans]QNT76743.1 carbamoyl-phosphate synthase large subunit [Dehalogenimonas etheniformans]
MPAKPSKVLIIGSGPIVIGQAAEFDYAGTQACKAMREEGVTSVLVNSNPATIMTDEEIADIVYIEPLTVESVSRIIERERPDGLLPTLGGQTGLNLAVDLADAGVLDKYNVRVLGTPIDTIRKAEDRELFKQLLLSIGEHVPPSETVTTVEEAKRVAGKLGLPLIIRPAYTLGGTGGGIANDMDEFEEIAAGGIAASPIHQILVEKSIAGWKEIEYEVMRDGANNCITVCNMENFDPVGVHTGDSIVIAPSQTLTNKEYQMLRTASINIIRALGIEGGCNIQYGLDPYSATYYVIEVNPRVSRSSALASKATGYPIARVAAKIATGKTLDQIPNAVTGKTMASFEPALDYVVVKIPRWPFDKFATGDRIINTQMKATGEVMAIDRTFEAALQKAVRSLEFGKKSILWEDSSWGLVDDISSYPLKPTDLRLWSILAALRRGITPQQIFQATRIDLWFLKKLLNIITMEKRLLSETLNPDLLREAKRLGFGDEQIATLGDRLPEQVRELRKQWKILPTYKMVDTCAAEFDAETPYFYSTYESENEAVPENCDKALVIGSGPIRIGQGIEFDYCSVHAAMSLSKAGYQSIMANSNPETVSTDFDTSNRLYFEPLDNESVRDILDNENSGCSQLTPSICQFGGQTAINLAYPLTRTSNPIIGSSAETIDLAEDRRRFEAFLSELDIPQAPGAGVTTLDEGLNVANLIGYPVLVRPSYVLGGRAMEIVYDASELVRFMKLAMELQTGHPVLIDKYLMGKECEVDAIADGQQVLIPGIMEHIERAGVHSGDSMAVYPGLGLTPEENKTIVDYTTRIGLALNVRGLMNVQFVIMRSEGQSKVYILEVNPRGSRTVPFLSKVTGVPMVDVAVNVMLGKSLKDQGYDGGLWPARPLVAIKAPVFSMSKLIGVDTYLGPEMKSTGEVMGVDHDMKGALIKALIAAGLALPPEGSILLSIADRDKAEALPLIRKLHSIGYHLYATEGTAVMIEVAGMPVKKISKKLSEGHPNIVDMIRQGIVSGVINTSTGGRVPLRDGFHIRRAAAEKRVPCFTSLDTARVAIDALADTGYNYNIKSMPEYRNGKE